MYGMLVTESSPALVIVVWWLFFSRAPWSERVGAIALSAGRGVRHKARRRPPFQLRTRGMGMMQPIFAIPVLSLALVAWAAASRRLKSGLNNPWMVASILLACGVFTLVRTGGISGEGNRRPASWRWTPTPRGTAPGPGPGRDCRAGQALASSAGSEDSRRTTRGPSWRDSSGGGVGQSATAVKTPEKGREAEANNEPRDLPPGAGRSDDGSRLAGLSRTRPVTASSAGCGSRPTGPLPAGRAVAPAVGPGCLLRGRRRADLYPGAARRR